MPVIKVKEGVNVIPTGLYVFQVKAINVQTAKRGMNAGNQFLVWEEDILEPEDFVGETFNHATPLNISPASKHFKLLNILGVPMPEEKQEVEYDTDNFIGKAFVAEVIVTKITDGANAGNEKNEFKNLWSPEGFQAHQNKAAALSNKLAAKPAGSATLNQQTPPVENAKLITPTKKLEVNTNTTSASKLTDFPT
jgi:hypothetical protein